MRCDRTQRTNETTGASGFLSDHDIFINLIQSALSGCGSGLSPVQHVLPVYLRRRQSGPIALPADGRQSVR